MNVADLESHWATYVAGLPHALSFRTPQMALECAVEAMGASSGDTVLVVGDIAPRVIGALLGVGAEPVACSSLADCESDVQGAVGIVVGHPTEGCVAWYDDLVRFAFGRGLWIVEDCGVRLDLGRASHVAVWSLIGGIAACLDDRVAARMCDLRTRDGYGMSHADAVRVVEALKRLRG